MHLLKFKSETRYATCCFSQTRCQRGVPRLSRIVAIDEFWTRVNEPELKCQSSTAVEQVVACAFVTQRARVRSLVGTSFLGEVFFGVFPHL